jgi:hypothetical protein
LGWEWTKTPGDSSPPGASAAGFIPYE